MNHSGILDFPHQSTTGIGREAEALLDSFLTLVQHQPEANVLSYSSAWLLESVFSSLVQRWNGETKYSSIIQISHPAYKRIIELGWPVLPLLLREMDDRPGHWHFALKSITHVDPVPREDRGDLHKVREHWLSWARANNLNW